MRKKPRGIQLLLLLLWVGGVHGFPIPASRTRNVVIEKKLSDVVDIRRRLGSISSIQTTSSRLQWSVPSEVLTSFLPPLLGLYKFEYTVSYGYGLSMALTGLDIFWKNTRLVNRSFLVRLHSTALLVFGARLCLFLAIRSRASQRIQQINENIEKRAKTRGNRFSTRIPLILSCGFLYYGLCVPLLFTWRLCTTTTTTTTIPSSFKVLMKILLVIEKLAFTMAAIGDLTKSFVKRKQRNEYFLVTSGLFSILRHPNYTGEIIGWTANALIGVVGAILLGPRLGPRLAVDLVLLGLSWVQILSVLLRATGNLEARQLKEYGNDEKYQQWIKSSWKGWAIPPKPKLEPESAT